MRTDSGDLNEDKGGGNMHFETWPWYLSLPLALIVFFIIIACSHLAELEGKGGEND